MKLRDAFTRAVRTFAATFVGVVALTGVGAFDSIDDVKGRGIQFAFAAVAGVFSGVITFVNCFAEDNTAYQLPK